MFNKKDKQRALDAVSSGHTGSLALPPQERDNTPLPTPPNSEGINRDGITTHPRTTTTTVATGPAVQPRGTLEPFALFDTPTNMTTYAPSTTTNSSSSTPTSSTRHPKQASSSSTLHPSALQSAYKRGAQSATTAADQIQIDMHETINIIANYAVEPLEILHLVDRWLQQLLDEFSQQQNHFKHELMKKWKNQELTNIKYDNNDRTRKIYGAHKELEKARDILFSRESFDELNNYLVKVDDDATEEMKEKFNLLVEQYFKILQCLEFVDKETKVGSGDNSIIDTKKNLIRLKKLNDKQSHTICIVGLEKAGKSTFINALLGYELLPTASERCTQIRTVLKPPSEDGDQQLLATVRFYNDQEFRLLFDKMTKKTDENQQQLEQRKQAVIQEREILKVKFPEEQFRFSSSSDVKRERTAIIEQLHKYITTEIYVNLIKEIAIYTDNLPGMHRRIGSSSCKNYELLDVPGFDSPIKEHRDAGLQAIKTADAFLFLTNGQQPSLTEPQIHLLQDIQQNHFEAMQRAFGIITKLDLCQTPTIYQDHYEKAYDELIDKHFKPERIYVACPRIQLLKEDSEEFRAINHKLQSFGDDLEHGFERSKSGLNKFIEYELPKTHLKQLVDVGRMRLARYVLERLDKIKEKQLLPQNLATMSIEDYIEQQSTEHWDEFYFENIFQPAFNKANHWHTTTITKERAKFIDDIKQKVHDSFLELTRDFVKRTYAIEQQMFEKHGYSKLQLNAHPTDNDVREKLSIEMEKIVDKTSDILAEYLYNRYICELENILNDICPQLKDLYRTALTKGKCANETHALILKVCRPVIMASLRYSHLDLGAKQDAINEFIYIAPTVAFNITNTLERGGSGVGIFGREILKSWEQLSGVSEMSPPVTKILFKK